MTTERDKCRAEFEDIRKQRLDQFMSGFSIITNKLKEMYQVGVVRGRSLRTATSCWPPLWQDVYLHTLLFLILQKSNFLGLLLITHIMANSEYEKPD